MNGFLNVAKPKGITSHDVVLEVRRVFREKKVGHLGTLDPMAIGVLPLALGSYTRLSEYLMNEDKEYLAEFMFGITTDTDDLDGNVLSMADCARLSRDRVVRALPKFTGDIEQAPPRFSAVHVGGKRLYDLARKGIEVDVPVRNVRVDHIHMLHWQDGIYPKAMFSMQVASGTYVRSLARDLGNELGCGCIVSYLLRTRVGNFRLKDSIALNSLRSKRFRYTNASVFVNPKHVFSDHVFLALKPESLKSIKHGVPLILEDFVDPQEVVSVARRCGGVLGSQSPVFMCTYTTSDMEHEEIACVVSFAFANESSLNIKYEKVLL